MATADTARLIATLELKDLFTKRISDAERSLGKFESRSTKAGRQIGTGILRGAAVAAAGVTAFSALFAKSLGAASDLNETVSKSGVVFGKYSDQVLTFGKDSASSLGLSQNAALSAAATYGNLFVSLGLTQSKAATMSTTMVKLAGDLASFNNASPEDTLLAIQAGLVGETEPLRRYGINLNDATLRQEALRLGLTKTTKEVLPPAIKAQAAYSIILKQSGTAQGDFERTSGGLANQIRILKANFTDMMATLAAPALPQVAKIFQRINDAVKANQPEIAKFGDAIAGLFSDENIKSGADILKGALATAKETAPIVAASAKATFGFVQGAVGLFKSLPPEIQKLAIGAFAVNKLTGGLVTNIAGGIIETVGKNVFQRGSTPANPLFVSQVGGLPSVPPAGPAGLSVVEVAAGAALLVGTDLALAQASGANAAQGQVKADAFGVNLPGGRVDRGLQQIIAEQRKTNGTMLAVRDNTVANVASSERQEALGQNQIQITNAALAAQRGEAAENRAALAGLPNEFGKAIKNLREAKQPENVAAAIKTALAQISKGRGNLAGTKDLISALKGQLSKTHDPKLQATLRAAIKKVEDRLPARSFAARQLAKADKLISDGKVTNRDLKDLKGIERALKDHGLPHAASVISKRVDAAKRAQVAAAIGTTAAVAAKKLSVTVNPSPITVINHVNPFESSKVQTTSRRAFVTLQ